MISGRQGGQGGFTLIELMLGLGLLALIMSIVQGVYSGVMRSRNVVQEQTEMSHAAALLLHRMADELGSSVPPPADEGGSVPGLALDKDENLDSTLEFTAVLSGHLQADGASRSSDLARIGYRVEKGDDGVRQLIRTDSRQTRDEGSTQAEGDVLLRGVTRFRVRVLAEGDDWRETSESAGPAAGGAGPRAVSVEVAWREGERQKGPERLLRTTAPIYGALDTTP